MADPAGINLRLLDGNDPAISMIPGTEEGAGSGNFDNWTFTIDAEALGLFYPGDGVGVPEGVEPGSPMEGLTEEMLKTVITIHGDWHRSDHDEIDGWEGTGFSGNYEFNPVRNEANKVVTFGDFNVEFDTGEMTWSFTYRELLENPGVYRTRVSGDWGEGASDADNLNLIIICFMPGTMIATPAGETAVEALAIGDMIKTADGREVAVKWVGRKTMKASVFLDQTMLPVCISAGALGKGLPHQDLYLSANHAMVMDGMLVNAGAMVNGDTIRFVKLSDMPATFTYYHVETEAHDEILANGAPAETFVDYVTRKGFDNYDEYVALYGSDRIIPEMKRLRVSSRRQLPQALRERLGVASFTDSVDADLQKLLAA